MKYALTRCVAGLAVGFFVAALAWSQGAEEAPEGSTASQGQVSEGDAAEAFPDNSERLVFFTRREGGDHSG